MAYTSFSDEQSCTLTTEERSVEAARILDMLRRIDTEEAGWTDNATRFVERKLAEMDLWDGKVTVSVKELFWLRDLKSKLD